MSPRFFRKGVPTHDTALTMVAPRSGQSVLIIGATDPALIARIALATGLNGRTVVVAEGDQAPKVEAAAADAGALVDVVDTPERAKSGAADGFDLVVVQAALATRDPATRRAIIRGAVQAIPAGRRIVVIEGSRTRGLPGVLRRATPPIDEKEGRELLADAGLLAVRLLATVDGQSFFEGRRREKGDGFN